MATGLRTVKAGEFKARCLALLDEDVLREQPIAITKRGKVVAHLVAPPAGERPFRSIVGRSPGVTLPSDEQWAKWKTERAKEWPDLGEKFADLLPRGKQKKQKS